MLLVKIAPHFPACGRMVFPPERFTWAFQFDRVVKGLRLRILALRLILSWLATFKPRPSVGDPQAIKVRFYWEI